MEFNTLTTKIATVSKKLLSSNNIFQATNLVDSAFSKQIEIFQ